MIYNNIEEFRAERNTRLAACDFTMLFDFVEKTPVGEIDAFKIYRQKLRDMPASYVEGQEVEWPELPPI